MTSSLAKRKGSLDVIEMPCCSSVAVAGEIVSRFWILADCVFLCVWGYFILFLIDEIRLEW